MVRRPSDAGFIVGLTYFAPLALLPLYLQDLVERAFGLAQEHHAPQLGVCNRAPRAPRFVGFDLERCGFNRWIGNTALIIKRETKRSLALS